MKPVGARCNMACSYCYYLDKSSLSGASGSIHLMDDHILETSIISHLEASNGEDVMFSWHGGEPLLAGIDFYRKAVTFQKKHNRKGIGILNGIQTNGSLLNEEWCRFFFNEKFHVGISIDGPPVMHDQFRKTSNGLPTYNRVTEGYRLLRDHGTTAEILCVVNSVNVLHPLEVYGLFRDMGARYITFLPLVERIQGKPGTVTDRSVAAEQFGVFLSEIFDYWVMNDIGQVKVQIFEEAARTAFDQDHTLCIFKKNCGGVPVIEADGSFYSCDHFVDEDHLIGNIKESSITQMLGAPRQTSFGNYKLQSLPQYCMECEVLDMCNGECPKNRFVMTPSGEPGLNYLCQGYRYFFNHCRPFTEAIRQIWKADKTNL